MVASAALRMETVKKVRSSEVEEKVEGGREIWEKKVKASQSALSKRQRGEGVGKGT